MKKRNILFVMSGVLLSCSLLVAIAFAQTGNAKPQFLLRSILDYKVQQLISDLELSETQLSDIKSIIKDARPEIKPRIDYIHNKRRLIRALLADDSTKDEELRSEFHAIQLLEEELFLERISLTRKLQGVLTQEQRSLIKDKRNALDAQLTILKETLQMSVSEWLESE